MPLTDRHLAIGWALLLIAGGVAMLAAGVFLPESALESAIAGLVGFSLFAIAVVVVRAGEIRRRHAEALALLVGASSLALYLV
jgi:peptidoglycan/LPS O-acetylase OafA/YrhL